jgi:hypothetical protein
MYGMNDFPVKESLVYKNNRSAKRKAKQNKRLS